MPVMLHVRLYRALRFGFARLVNARNRVAEAGWCRTGKNVQAGGSNVARDRAREGATRAVDNARAAFPANALTSYAGRAKTAMTIA